VVELKQIGTGSSTGRSAASARRALIAINLEHLVRFQVSPPESGMLLRHASRGVVI
jgi:hypothetical protein